MKRNGKRGMTLVEVCVVVAIVSLISLTLVTFIVFVSRETKSSAKYLEVAREIRLTEELIESEICNTGTANGINFTDGVLKINEKVVNLSAVRVESLENRDSDEAFYVCVLKYELGGEEYTYRFSVDPIINDVVRCE